MGGEGRLEMGGLRNSPTYIYRHSSSYIFRITTPVDIVPYINKKEFRYSLRTGSLSVAKFRARVIVSMIQMLFKDISRLLFQFVIFCIEHMLI